MNVMDLWKSTGTGPHAGQPVSHVGAPLDKAAAAMILLHGRGGSAPDILSLAEAFGRSDVAYLAPQAAHNTWWPQRFIQPVAANQPYLDSALDTVGALAETLVAADIPREKIVLLGFSQGACLALEFAARNPRRWGGVVGLSGGLVGSDDEFGLRQGSLAATPVILACSDRDAHIPLLRVRMSAKVFEAMGAAVDCRIYPGMGHTVSMEEVGLVRDLMKAVTLAA